MANFNALQMGCLVKALMKGGTANEVAERTGFHPATVRLYLRTWHRQKLIHIDRWKRDTTFKPVAIYRLDTLGLPDAEKPKPLTQHERNRRSYERKLARQGKLLGSLRVAA